ncbi:response regulator transcription factor [Streptomyces sp. NPDC002935]|uniref:response regulator transcription factor n=1 Tax=unclassified Streptomyces TaxID=2593676 RepID=UPI00331C7B04
MSESDRPVRVVIVDDHRIVLDGLSALLDSVEGIDVIGEAASGEEAVTLVGTLQPDVILMDVEMPGIGGVEATRRITAAHPGIAVVMLTMYGEDEFLFSALRAGAHGYLLKGAQQEDVVRTLGAVARGGAVFGADVARRVLETFSDPRPAAVPFPQLTEREREVLALLANGWPNSRIARHLALTSKTVANHVSNILTKLQMPDRAAAMLRARRAGLGEP